LIAVKANEELFSPPVIPVIREKAAGKGIVRSLFFNIIANLFKFPELFPEKLFHLIECDAIVLHQNNFAKLVLGKIVVTLSKLF